MRLADKLRDMFPRHMEREELENKLTEWFSENPYGKNSIHFEDSNNDPEWKDGNEKGSRWQLPKVWQEEVMAYLDENGFVMERYDDGVIVSLY